MGERKLPTRRKRAPKGRAIRVSNLVYDTLDSQRRNGVARDRVRSWDSFMRRVFGLPDRSGVNRPLVEGMLEVLTGMFILKLEDATWSEVESAAGKLADSVARKRKLKVVQPIRMREAR